jgi:hypothetical protein
MVKVKFTLEQGIKAQRGSRCIVLLFLQAVPNADLGRTPDANHMEILFRFL